MHAQHSQHPIEMLREHYRDKIRKLNEIFDSREYKELTGLTDSELPQEKIKHFLDELDTILLDANQSKYHRALLQFITALPCFHYHVFDEKRPQRLWNPLDEDFQSFASRVKYLSYHFSDSPYPPSEVILKWLDP